MTTEAVRGKLPACRHSHPVGVFHTFKRTGERGDETFLDAPERKSSLEKGRREKRWGAAKAGLPFPAGRKNPECGKRAHRNSHGRRTGRTTVPLADFLLNGSATPMRYPRRKLRTTALSPSFPSVQSDTLAQFGPSGVSGRPRCRSRTIARHDKLHSTRALPHHASGCFVPRKHYRSRRPVDAALRQEASSEVYRGEHT